MALAAAHRTDEGPRPRGIARRDALLEAALRIVADVGPDAVTHRRVAEVAGLPLASTTYWFRSKEHLLTAAFELAAERDTARLLEFALSERARNADPLDAAVEAVLDPIWAGSGVQAAARRSLTTTYALLVEAARRPELREASRRWTAAYLETLGELMQRAGSARPREDAELLLAAADGLLMQALAGGGDGDLRPTLRRLAEALVSQR
jgi:TetR/AcrR family transcriptional regulator, regulator of biofilm formation and stress response